ncbi:UNVERIFIED_CONTAM: hypothetical protein K2H54_062013 [Gekko kuhli]
MPKLRRSFEEQKGKYQFPTHIGIAELKCKKKQKLQSSVNKLWRLDANLISVVPDKSFEGLPSLRHLWLDDNALTEIPVRALNNLPALQAMTLALNQIWHIPDYAFQNLTSLVVL